MESGLSRNMIIGIGWGRKSVAYERLWDVAGVLGCSVVELLTAADQPASSSPYRGGRKAAMQAGRPGRENDSLTAQTNVAFGPVVIWEFLCPRREDGSISVAAR